MDTETQAVEMIETITRCQDHNYNEEDLVNQMYDYYLIKVHKHVHILID